jgi:DNA polymerase-3 subunit gamma/tau
LADASDGPVTVREPALREMLGLADRTALFDLFDALMRGAAAEALDGLGAQYNAGADPATVLQDLLELAHWLTRLKIVPAAADDPGVPEVERVRGREMAEKLSLAVLNRVWQMLLKGLEEARFAPQPMAAAEMVLIRLCHAADLPTPMELVEAARGGKGAGSAGAATATAPTTTPTTTAAAPRPRAEAPASSSPDDRPVASVSSRGAEAALATDPRHEPEARAEPAPAEPPLAEPELTASEAAESTSPVPDSFEALVQLVADRREPILGAHLRNNVHLVHYAPGRLEYRPAAHAPGDLPRKLSERLQQWTGRPWFVTTVNEGGAPTLLQQQEEAAAAQEAAIGAHPVVQAVMQAFPGTEIESIRPLREADLATDTGLDADDDTVPEDEASSEEDDA